MVELAQRKVLYVRKKENKTGGRMIGQNKTRSDESESYDKFI